ncbi:CehA/McbA family metallohydrolase [Neobacillus ginsengisoli]|uniref:Polymerase/histidinol phosphatase N-terminal domain-containing protein n=1 Tax=Neobacillus ginsengisoli TaxID=904295 RepID=A0ABT9XWB3_9BACI|nr:CehA/McbA family metallohydrolase [Neobacillus ginsengisoli]MDQ0199847.1 hypothetical protein [Neobacillus ginsengisoli]
MKTLVLTRIIAREEELQYIEVPFHMPKSIQKILVNYEVKSLGQSQCVVDLGIKDFIRVRGWSGGARREFYIGKNQATPGYVSGPLFEGEWSILLGAYKIPIEGCQVIITVSLESESEEACWLKGDLHLHSVHSDGSYTIEENAKIAKEKGLDFIALTDHNTISQNYMHESYGDVLFIPGMELTTYKGHCNLYGVKDPIKDFRATNREEIKNRLQEARNNGCKISINHPFDQYCPWEWDWDVDYDWVEVWNGPWTEGNERAIHWWQEQLVQGRKLVVVGGSDCHRPHPYVKQGMPTTWVYSHSKSVSSILDAIHKGHVYLTYDPMGPQMEFTCGLATIGDTIKTQEKMKLKVNKLQEGDIVKIISNKGIEQEFKMANEQGLYQSWHSEGKTFYRVEIWRYFLEVEGYLMAALSNPIYIQQGE